ncbi:SEC-C metal-binding domain-containing protein [Paenibacillus dakarensis]|uniref:SEC-C metal-binding domain-containing protein n=1 Tax=Paenibacillus dakarensis TaxID=1527293 RepID=UPI0006D58C6E|nr:SEC-C metal-binding domain-containing protein [Paenibacillus dakarensis]
MNKIGRNDACHCGSGKKYKKCCLEKDRKAERQPHHIEPSHEEKQALLKAPSNITEFMATLNNMKWDNESYRQLAEELFPQLYNDYEHKEDEKLFVLYNALIIWNGFCQKESPRFRKPGGFKAALEQLYTKALDISVTQAELAAKYDVAATTLSKSSNQLSEFMEQLAVSK